MNVSEYVTPGLVHHFFGGIPEACGMNTYFAPLLTGAGWKILLSLDSVCSPGVNREPGSGKYGSQDLYLQGCGCSRSHWQQRRSRGGAVVEEEQSEGPRLQIWKGGTSKILLQSRGWEGRVQPGSTPETRMAYPASSRPLHEIPLRHLAHHFVKKALTLAHGGGLVHHK